MIKLILFIIIILCVGTVSAAYWVDDPNNCPVTSSDFPGQSCSPTMMCGDISGTIQCYDTSSLVAPASDTQVSSTQWSASYSGGYLVDCFATGASDSPYCDNDADFWCNRDASCYSTQNRYTNCSASSFGTFVCAKCLSGRQNCTSVNCDVVTGTTNCPVGSNNHYIVSCACDCDTSYSDCDSSGPGVGDGCEIHDWVTNYGPSNWNNRYNASCGCSCDSGYLDCNALGCNVSDGCEIDDGGSCGTGHKHYDGCAAGTGNCTCDTGWCDCDATSTDCEKEDGSFCTLSGVNGTYDCGTCGCIPGKSYFETGTLAQYLTAALEDSILWFKNFGDGWLIKASNKNDEVWGVDNNSCIVFKDNTTQCSASSSGTGTKWNITGSEYIINVSNILDVNETKLNANYYNKTLADSIYVKIAGDNMTGNLNMSGNELSDVGKLIITGLTISQDIIPDTTELYSIGNSTIWFEEAYIKIIYGEDVYTENLNASEINSTDINSDTIDIDNNLTVAGYKIHNDSNNLVVILT